MFALGIGAFFYIRIIQQFKNRICRSAPATMCPPSAFIFLHTGRRAFHTSPTYLAPNEQTHSYTHAGSHACVCLSLFPSVHVSLCLCLRASQHLVFCASATLCVCLCVSVSLFVSLCPWHSLCVCMCLHTHRHRYTHTHHSGAGTRTGTNADTHTHRHRDSESQREREREVYIYIYREYISIVSKHVLSYMCILRSNLYTFILRTANRWVWLLETNLHFIL